MKITRAKTAGFCFGVNRAVSLVEKSLINGEVKTLGPIIHNPQTVSRLSRAGAKIIDDAAGAAAGDRVVIRSHGVAPQVEDELRARGAVIIDATCPFVKKIQEIVKKNHKSGRPIIIVGDESHPEVVGISGACDFKARIVSDKREAAKTKLDNACIVVQTTMNRKTYEEILQILKNTCQNAVVFDTICNATDERQREAAQLAAENDGVVVIGGRDSSNTRKLVEICSLYCDRVYHVEKAEDLPRLDGNIAVTAGASTPDWIIKEVVKAMEEKEVKREAENEGADVEQVLPEAVEELSPAEESAPEAAEAEEGAPEAAEAEESAPEAASGEMSFAEAFEQSLVTLNTGDIVKGTVIGITPTEVYVNLGFKADGVITVGELTDDPLLKPEDIVSVGDDIEVFVVRVNDVEGTVMLSKKKLDSIKGWQMLESAFDEGTPLEGRVISVVNGGVIALCEGIRIFVPASQASDRYLSDLSVLENKTVPLKIIDINKKRRKIVASVRAVLSEQKEKKSAVFWAKIDEGQKEFTGVVKTLTNFGAFVDLGGIDGLIHISELSWGRIKHPSEVVSEGDEVNVTVLSADKEKNKVSLGYKKEEDNPWAIAKAKFSEGDILNVKVVRMVPFGAFVELLPGIDGLVHISQIANRRIDQPSDELSIGQVVPAKITEINWETQKIGLSIRELLPDEPPPAAAQEEDGGYSEDSPTTISDITDGLVIEEEPEDEE